MTVPATPDMPTTPVHSVSVAGAVINRDGLILAIRRTDNDHWEPPGGVLELDETIEAGLVREIREETGLTVKPERLTGVYKNMPRGIIALVFRCAVVPSFDYGSRDEVQEVVWLTRAEVSERMEPAYAVRILDALEIRDPAVRAHDGHQLCQGS